MPKKQETLTMREAANGSSEYKVLSTEKVKGNDGLTSELRTQNSELLSMREAARYLGIGRSCMCYHLTHDHCPGARKIGGRWRVPVRDLQHIKRTPGPKRSTECQRQVLSEKC